MTQTSFLSQTWIVFRRTARDAQRNFAIAFVAPTLLSSFVAIIFAAVFAEVVNTPGFPADSFVVWIAPAAVLLTAFVGAGFAAGALLRDIETGYLDRLRLLAVPAAAIVLGRAAFEGVRVVPPATVVLGGSLAFGAENHNGIAGFAALIGMAIFVAIAWNGIFFYAAIATKSQAAVLGLQPLFMPVIMFSTFFAPTTNMPSWFRAIVEANPFTYLLDASRGILAASLVTSDLAIGLGAFGAIGAVTYLLAGRAFSGVVTAD